MRTVYPPPSTGIPSIDRVLSAIIPGDNIVWQVDDLAVYRRLAERFARASLQAGRKLVYFRFAEHDPVLSPMDGVEVSTLDPSIGFDAFAQEAHTRIGRYGRDVFYVFDNLSDLVSRWGTDESIANFFRVACPYLYELDTVTYFALKRGMHLDRTVARIRDTTQVLVDVFQRGGQTFLHPLKALDRYSPTMFLPHVFRDDECVPVFESGQAAEILSSLRSTPLRGSPAAGTAPWDRLFGRVGQLRETGRDLRDLSDPEIRALRDELLRMVFGERPALLQVAERYIDPADLLEVRERMIGSGRIGGKAAGMILARKILSSRPEMADVLEPHDSFYIGSDIFFSFLVDNDLFSLRLRQSRDVHTAAETFPALRERFLAGRFPPDVVEQFSRMLDYFGQAPIIVRSSSLLEDDFGNAFAGKYESVFCPNQGHLPDRLEAFMNAVKQVYASALSPDALAYRLKHNLADSDEQMAILVQRVAGRPVGRLFLPLVAGVGFSHSPYVWSDELDASQGMLRVVVGLGTRAVDRVGGDYPRTIFLSHPTLRPEVDAARILKYSQHSVDALDIVSNQFVTVPVAELAAGEYSFPEGHLLFSWLQDGHLADPVSAGRGPRGARPVVTLNNLLRRTDFTAVLRTMLSALQEAYGHPVDTEFTVSLREDGRVRVNLLQCRTLSLPGGAEGAEIPADLPAERVLFEARRCAAPGVVRGITHIVYIDPDWYTGLSLDLKRQVGRVVGRLNRHPALDGARLMLMGPGRWGSSNIELGVNVTYADINNAAVLVEVARSRGGHTPEVSYGTHFFQDLVEDGILYVPLYPDRPECRFAAEFFLEGPNALENLLPEWAVLHSAVRLIDVRGVAGTTAALVVDAAERRAVCYLEEAQ
ncbi:MAG: PEP/pyruvate-binding domain-containing protein [Armatimonadota bacterium]